MGRFGALWNPRPQRCPRDPASPGRPRRAPSQALQSSPPPGPDCGQDPPPRPLDPPRGARFPCSTHPQPAPTGQALPCLAVCISGFRWPRVTPFFQGGVPSPAPPHSGLGFPFPRTFSQSRNPGAELSPVAGPGVA